MSSQSNSTQSNSTQNNSTQSNSNLVMDMDLVFSSTVPKVASKRKRISPDPKAQPSTKKQKTASGSSAPATTTSPLNPEAIAVGELVTSLSFDLSRLQGAPLDSSAVLARVHLDIALDRVSDPDLRALVNACHRQLNSHIEKKIKHARKTLKPGQWVSWEFQGVNRVGRVYSILRKNIEVDVPVEGSKTVSTESRRVKVSAFFLRPTCAPKSD